MEHDVVLSGQLAHAMQMIDVFLGDVATDEEVVDVDPQPPFGNRLRKHLFHPLLEISRSIAKPKGEHVVLVVATLPAEAGPVLVRLGQWDLVIAADEVQRREISAAV